MARLLDVLRTGAHLLFRPAADSVETAPIFLPASALLLGLISSLFVLAVMNASVANVVVILSTAPLFAALFSRVFLGEQVPRHTLVAMVACMLGMGLVFMGDGAQGMLLGNLYARPHPPPSGAT